MEKYIGVKAIMARPMSSATAEQLGYKVTHCDNGTENIGYEVEYEDGYKSWSPASAFEKAYVNVSELIVNRNVEPYAEHQERVITEFQELVTKTEALGKFLLSDFFKTIDPAEQERLKNQELVMTAYALILKERISNF